MPFEARKASGDVLHADPVPISVFRLSPKWRRNSGDESGAAYF